MTEPEHGSVYHAQAERLWRMTFASMAEIDAELYGIAHLSKAVRRRWWPIRLLRWILLEPPR